MNHPLQIGVVGINHRTAPVEIREKFAIAEDRIKDTLQELIGFGTIREAVIVSTCNRVEVYFLSSQIDQSLSQLAEFLKSKANKPDAGTVFYSHSHPQSIQHLYEVCCGLDSMVVGETEISGQIKDFYQMAHEAECTGGSLNKLFQSAFAVSKYIRSQTRIGMGSVSVGSVAADLASQIFGDLSNHTVLLVGAGSMSEVTAKALQSRGAKSLKVTNRSPERAAKLAADLSGEALAWDNWTEECRHVDVIISSTSSPNAVITRKSLEPVLKHRNGNPLFLIDIAVPRDVEREVSQLEGVYLYDIDDLQVIADQNMAMRQKEIAVCKQIIRERVDQYEQWFQSRLSHCSSEQGSNRWLNRQSSSQSGFATA